MTPKAFVEKYRAEQHQDFKRFGVEFDLLHDRLAPRTRAGRTGSTTRSRRGAHLQAVDRAALLRERPPLPARPVRRTCPKCGAKDQYGDVCEVCGTTADPRDLLDPRCAICGTTPIVRSSDHAYVDLSKVEGIIRGWVEAEGHLEPAVREQVKGWLADLQDWCITRRAVLRLPGEGPGVRGQVPVRLGGRADRLLG